MKQAALLLKAMLQVTDKPMIKKLELLIPPPIVAFVCAIAMWLLWYAFPGYEIFIAGTFRLVVALVLVVLGMILGLGAVLGFRRQRTTVNPMDPQATSALVTGGLYRFSRNPMYLGVLLFLIAFAVALGNPVSVVPVVCFVLYITIFQIKPEERIIAENFGDAFSDYSGKVRRWI